MAQTLLFDDRVAILSDDGETYRVVNQQEIWGPDQKQGISSTGKIMRERYNITREDFEEEVKVDYGVRTVKWI